MPQDSIPMDVVAKTMETTQHPPAIKWIKLLHSHINTTTQQQNRTYYHQLQDLR